MAQESVNEVLTRITPAGNTPNRFSKKSFNDLMKAMLNDTEFVSEVAVTKNKELADVQKVMVTKEFRGFLKRILEKAGVDKAESAMVLDPTFTIDNVDGLYDFMTAAIYEYMDAKNTFEFPAKKDFRGKLNIKEKAATKKTSEARNPQTGESLGTWEYETKPYKTLVASSPAPEYLKTRRKLHD